jgi:hypothetical protein
MGEVLGQNRFGRARLPHAFEEHDDRKVQLQHERQALLDELRHERQELQRRLNDEERALEQMHTRDNPFVKRPAPRTDFRMGGLKAVNYLLKR